MEDRVKEQLTKWRDELINLSRNNRLLYFRETKVSTLKIVQPGPDEVLNRLYDQDPKNNCWKFYFPSPLDDDEEDLAQEESEGKLPDGGQPSNQLLLDNHSKNAENTALNEPGNEVHEKEVFPVKPPIIPPDEDELVTSKKDPAELNRALNLLSRKATQEFMDKGLRVLYMGIGMLYWTDPLDNIESRSPILLVPVLLVRGSPREPYRLKYADEDSVINPALGYKLGNDFGITLPNLEQMDDGISLDGLFVEIRKLISEQDNWEIKPEVVLGNFSFHKEAMYRDLLEHEELICSHELVNGIVMGANNPGNLDFDPIPEEELDEKAPPERMASILDADASQRQCIAAARDGHSFVMDGPPGTGKSQTIANIIAELITHGRSVLFVSEKAAALEVVHSRLESAGLDNYALELHSHKATRKELAQELGRSVKVRATINNGRPIIDTSRLEMRRKELSDYSCALNEIRHPFGRNVHNVIGRICSLQNLITVPTPKKYGDQLTPKIFDAMLDAAAALARAWDPVERGDEFLWRELKNTEYNSARKGQLERQIKLAYTKLEELERALFSVANKFHLDEWTLTVDNAKRLSELIDLSKYVELPPRMLIPPKWLGSPLTSIEFRLNELVTKANEFSHLVKSLQKKAGLNWDELNADQMEPLKAACEAMSNSSLISHEMDSDQEDQLVEFLTFVESAIKLIAEAKSDTSELCSAFGLAASDVSFSRAMDIINLGLMIGAVHRPENSWFYPANIPSVKEAVANFEELISEYNQIQDDLRGLFTEEIMDLDLEGLNTRFATIYQNLFGKIKSHSMYRQDKKQIAACTTIGKVSDEIISKLPRALMWKKAKEKLVAYEQQKGSLIGDFYYAGSETEFASIHTALTVAEKVQNISRDNNIDPEYLVNQLAREIEPNSRLFTIAQKLNIFLHDWAEEAHDKFNIDTERFPGKTMGEVIAACQEAVIPLKTIIDSVKDVSKTINRDASVREVRELLDKKIIADEIRSEIESSLTEDAILFGAIYVGLDSDFSLLQSNLEWTENVIEIIGIVEEENTAAALLQVDLSKNKLGQALKNWVCERDKIADEFIEPRNEFVRNLLNTTFVDVKKVLDDFENTTGDIQTWAYFLKAKDKLEEEGAKETVDYCIAAKIPTQKLSEIIEKAILECWVDEILENDARLQHYRAKDRNDFAAEFRSLDNQMVKVGAARAMEACNMRRPKTNAGVVGIILREAEKKRRHMPIRTLLQKTEGVVKDIKPCFMMSPLSVSQYLPSNIEFDTVIFDEASQVRPSDAINCIYRGKQLIVAGDQKQLPPTSFFEKTIIDDGDEYEEEQLDEFESVLDLSKSSGAFRSLPLKWHYRSQHEDLITYSNYSFYGGALITFPGSTHTAQDMGVELIQVYDGVYRRGGARDNPIEAQKVVERALFHLRNHPENSLGIVSFSEAQATSIWAELERQSLDNPELDSFFDGKRLDGSFVKNLENVQGDERDTIIFSVGYGKDEVGKFTMNFGPINQAGGPRRLNVAITRARRRVEIVSSVMPSDFSASITNEGVRHLKRYLEYAKDGPGILAYDIDDTKGDFESPFEEEVARVIQSWAFEVKPQVGCAGYRVDIGVCNPADPGSFALGIECDGAMYHSSKVARDRDRLRQEVLERLGWNIYRIWGPAWYRDRMGQEEQLKGAIERSFDGKCNRTIKKASLTKSLDDDVQYETVGFDGSKEWTIFYTVAKPASPKHKIQIFEVSARPIIKEMIKKVLEIEGPVLSELVLRRVLDAWYFDGTPTATPKRRAAFNQAVNEMVKSRDIVSIKSYLLLPGQKVVKVRVPKNDEFPKNIRSIDEIPNEELDLAIRKMVEDARVIEEDELTLKIAQLFGWKRRVPKVHKILRQGVNRLIRDRIIVRKKQLLNMAKKESF